ncbi:MBL fold metallo-hydrolase [Massilia sp. CF038]|uniref:MBL fold metallo-hydrolase n=1 Tax=Massilia sp. CF038 TaxID=1881045 RepID=UPI0009196885|nr:MBL fold metallo-hydrolase [Massilia sp. CF038]SHH71560.1 Glyoxylase, beta-lactamase superfamily II [Massilia sp. CF038]
MSIRKLLFPALLAGAVAHGSAGAAALTLDVVNPGEAAIFPVASVLVAGKRDAILVDAQFSRAEAQKLAERIRASGKRLTTIYISHGDPDFYFGLDVLQQAFPDAKIVATAQTVEAMHKKADAKAAYWGPILKENAPQKIVYPEALKGNRLTLEGKALIVSGPTPERTYLWIPSIKAVVGGVVLFNGLHVWMADSQTAQSRQDWLATLDGIAALHPNTVVPGHFAPGAAMTPASIAYTRAYVTRFSDAADKAANSGELVTTMQKLYPTAGLQSGLQTSAKVAKGEIKW